MIMETIGPVLAFCYALSLPFLFRFCYWLEDRAYIRRNRERWAIQDRDCLKNAIADAKAVRATAFMKAEHENR